MFIDAAKRALATGAKPQTPEFKTALRVALFSSKEVIGAHAIYNFTPASSFGVDDRSRVMVRMQKGRWVLVPNE